jgi:hypothetical protein
MNSMLQRQLLGVYTKWQNPLRLNQPASCCNLHFNCTLCIPTPSKSNMCHSIVYNSPAKDPILPLLQRKRNLESHLLLDFRNGQTWVQALRASPRAVQNSMTPVQTHAVIQRRLSLLLLLISAIRQPSVTLQQHCRAKVFLRVPPVRRAGGGAAGAENALVEAIQLLTVFLGLQVFFSVWRRS